MDIIVRHCGVKPRVPEEVKMAYLLPGTRCLVDLPLERPSWIVNKIWWRDDIQPWDKKIVTIKCLRGGHVWSPPAGSHYENSAYCVEENGTYFYQDWLKPIPENNKPVCSKCLDTHLMVFNDAHISCTFCPLPCQDCRAEGVGAFCGLTPCACSCHVLLAKGNPRLSPTEELQNLKKELEKTNLRLAETTSQLTESNLQLKTIRQRRDQTADNYLVIIETLRKEIDSLTKGNLRLKKENNEHLGIKKSFLSKLTKDNCSDVFWISITIAISIIAIIMIYACVLNFAALNAANISSPIPSTQPSTKRYY